MGAKPPERGAVRGRERLRVRRADLHVHTAGAATKGNGVAQSNLEAERVAFEQGAAPLRYAQRYAPAEIAAALYQFRQPDCVDDLEGCRSCLLQ